MTADDDRPAADDDRPRNVEAERAVIGAMMLDGGAVAAVLPMLAPDDFYRPAHAALYTTIVGLFEAGGETDPVSVSAALARDGDLLRVGGAPYLHDLIEGVPTTGNVRYWAGLVADAARRARLVDAGTHLRQLAREGADVDAVVDRARDIIETAAARDGDDQRGGWIGDIIDGHIAGWEDPEQPGIPTPYLDLTDLLDGDGLQPGQVVIVAGRPGVGKSVVGADFAVAAAKAKVGTVLFSLEMTRRELLDRMIAADAGVRLSDIRRRDLNPADVLRVEAAQQTLGALPLRIEDQAVVTLATMRAAAREAARAYPLGMIVVDYIQLVTPADPRVSREQQVSAISRGLKILAKELGVVVVIAAQLNRGPEQRHDKVPVLSDLRESGALEQDADIVILLHRPDKDDRESPRAGEADLIVAKHRGGPTATITVAHQLHYSRFRDLARGR